MSEKIEGLDSAEMDDGFDEFTLAEMLEMENLFKEAGEKSLSQEFCQEVATRFSCSIHRTGKSAVTWEQVHSWFLDKQRELVAKINLSHAASVREFRHPTDLIIMNNPPESPQKSKAERIASLSELAFEAISSKDFAWYDVASFLNYRVLCTGELEVRARFSGFGNEEDEWVNVKRGVRERSIPLEPSECDQVQVGDLVLCYRKTDDHSIYCDAYVMEIQRRLHDCTDCSCTFVVRYDYDHAEDRVDLTRICRRPK